MSIRLLLFWVFAWNPFWLLGPGYWLASRVQPGGDHAQNLIYILLYGYGLFAPAFWAMWRESRRDAKPQGDGGAT